MTDLKALSDAATQGEWGIYRPKGSPPIIRTVYYADVGEKKNLRHTAFPATVNGVPGQEENAAFICALVNEYRANRLAPMSEVEGLVEAVVRARDAIDEAHDQERGRWALGRLHQAEELIHAAGSMADALEARND